MIISLLLILQLVEIPASQVTRVASCTAAAYVGSTCVTPVKWRKSWKKTPYAVVCQVDSPEDIAVLTSRKFPERVDVQLKSLRDGRSHSSIITCISVPETITSP